MAVFSKRPGHSRADYACDEEENVPFLGPDTSELFIKEGGFPRRSKLEKPPAKTPFIAKLIMGLLTAVVIGACIRGVVGSSKQG